MIWVTEEYLPAKYQIRLFVILVRYKEHFCNEIIHPSDQKKNTILGVLFYITNNFVD